MTNSTTSQWKSNGAAVGTVLVFYMNSGDAANGLDKIFE